MKGIIYIGIQASGKSTFYLSRFSKTHIRLNMDMLKTRNREKILFEACLAAKQPVVIDNTNPTKNIRSNYIEQFKKHKFDVIGYYFTANLKRSLRLNAYRKGKERVPDVGLKGTFSQLELPSYQEGFDSLYYVSIENNDFVVKEWEDEV